MTCYSSVSGFCFHCFSVWSNQYTGHQSQRTETLCYGIRLHVAIVVFTSPNEVSVPLQCRSNHIVDQTVLVSDSRRVHRCFKFCLINVFKNVLETTIVLLKDGVFSAQIQRPAFRDGLVETRASKSFDTFVGVVHGQSHAIAFEIIYFVLNDLSVFAFKFDCQFAFSFGYEIGSAVLIAKSVTADTDWCCPVWN